MSRIILDMSAGPTHQKIICSPNNDAYMCSQVLAKNYLDVIEAPKKKYFAFTNSAHSPNMEEPELFIQIFRKIALENQ